MAYDPDRRSDRIALASAVEKTVLDAGFFEEWHGDAGDHTRERTFTRPVDGCEGVRVVVYTSIVGDEVRTVGADAIRVVALYHSDRLGKERGIVSETRVHRTGEITAVCDRLLDRMRSVYRAALRPHRCPRCSAPMFRAKSGKDVCADLCWKSLDDIRADNASWRSHRRGGRRRRW